MYELEGTKWGAPTFGTPSGTINWQDDLGGLPTAGGSNTGSLVTALNSAFNAWENVAALDFQEGGAIDLQIGFSSFSTDSIATNDQAAGTASWTISGGSLQPANATITFNSDLTWASSSGAGTNFYAVALHEIGHIIGLGHVADQSEIMNEIIFANGLGDGDIQGAQTLYGTDGDDAPVPPSGGGGISGGGGDGGGGGGGAIGLVVGILALVIGIFTGGAGAAVAIAAGRMATDEERDDASDVADTDDFDHLEHVDIAADGTMTVTHTTFLADMPMIDFGPAPGMDEDEEFEDAFFI